MSAKRKLTDEQVLDIRRGEVTLREYAQKHNVSCVAAWKVQNRRSYAWIGEDGLPNKVSPKQVSAAIRSLSWRMKSVAEMVRPYSNENADQMAGAADMAMGWALAIMGE